MLTDAALTFIALPDDATPDTLSVIVAAGRVRGRGRGFGDTDGGLHSGRAVRERTTLRVEHLQYSPAHLSSDFGPHWWRRCVPATT